MKNTTMLIVSVILNTYDGQVLPNSYFKINNCKNITMNLHGTIVPLNFELNRLLLFIYFFSGDLMIICDLVYMGKCIPDF